MHPNIVPCNWRFALLCWLLVLAACSDDTTVLTGIDVLARDKFQPLHASRVALITIRLTITAREIFDPLRVGFEIARHLAIAYADTWDVDAYLRLLGNDRSLQAVRDGLPYSEILASYEDGLNAFRERRSRYLLYP